ncbi:MAG: hypothetical protein ACHQSE_06130 [Gemmatimonadales bacterium]
MEHREHEKADRMAGSRPASLKPYVAPRLRIYGNLAALTRTIGHKSMKADGGSGMTSKTG